jgi:tagatose 1,6-diphosphate aldolase
MVPELNTRKQSMPSAMFQFLDPGRLVDGDLQLVLVKKVPPDPARRHVPSYLFEMRKTGGHGKIGWVSFRVGSARRLRCPGHLGWRVNKRSRGRRYAARSTILLLPFARAHGIKVLWITCEPTNTASRKTCDLAGARYVETIRVPREHEMYNSGFRYLRRYRISLRDNRILSSETKERHERSHHSKTN